MVRTTVHVVGTARSTRRRVIRTPGVTLAGSVGASALAACGLPGQPGEAVPEARDVTLSYVTDWSSGGRSDFLKVAIPKFTAENPRITVRVDNWSGDVLAAALTNAAAGTLQDVMLNQNDLFIQLARGGEMKDITPALKSLRVNMNDLVSMPSTYAHAGKQYGLPFQYSIATMMINKTLFKQNGAALPDDKTTYPQLLESLRKIAPQREGLRPAVRWRCRLLGPVAAVRLGLRRRSLDARLEEVADRRAGRDRGIAVLRRPDAPAPGGRAR